MVDGDAKYDGYVDVDSVNQHFHRTLQSTAQPTP